MALRLNKQTNIVWLSKTLINNALHSSTIQHRLSNTRCSFSFAEAEYYYFKSNPINSFGPLIIIENEAK